MMKAKCANFIPGVHQGISAMLKRIGLEAWAAAAALCAVLLVPSTCLAQGTGVIYGTVTDASGAGIPGAQITAVLTDRGTTRTGTSGPHGGYVFSAMPIGTYDI